MKEIKFRGKRIDNGEWIYGYLVKDPQGRSKIYWQPFPEAYGNTYHFVNPDTVNQWTQLRDKYGKEIYGGDIINDGQFSDIIVSWYEPYASFVLTRKRWAYRHWFGESCEPSDVMVIGNVYDSPELITPKLT